MTLGAMVNVFRHIGAAILAESRTHRRSLSNHVMPANCVLSGGDMCRLEAACIPCCEAESRLSQRWVSFTHLCEHPTDPIERPAAVALHSGDHASSWAICGFNLLGARVTDRRLLAGEQLRTSIAEMLAGRFDLPQFLHSCRDACLTAGLEDDAEWFRREIMGYGDDAPLPHYRSAVPGTLTLRPLDPLNQRMTATRYMSDKMGTTHPQVDQSFPRAEPMKLGIDTLIALSREGVMTGEAT